MSLGQTRPEKNVLLEDIETLSGLKLCIKNFNSPSFIKPFFEKIPRKHTLHTTPFCLNTKLTRNELCCQCDLRDVPQKAATIRKVFVNRCHAGASEVIIPLPGRQHIIGLGYIGQFRTEDDQPHELPQKSPEQVSQLLTLGTLIQQAFLYEMEHTTPPEGSSASRKGQIFRFLQQHLKEDVSLSELAAYLSLSPSRTGHLIKELTGKTFVDLKLELRLEMAFRLLARTVYTIETIAEETGFQDVRYFYRVFQKATGHSPGKWRELNQPKEPVA